MKDACKSLFGIQAFVDGRLENIQIKRKFLCNLSSSSTQFFFSFFAKNMECVTLPLFLLSRYIHGTISLVDNLQLSILFLQPTPVKTSFERLCIISENAPCQMPTSKFVVKLKLVFRKCAVSTGEYTELKS